MASQLSTSRQSTPDIVVQLEVAEALKGYYTATAGKKMERWVHNKVQSLQHAVAQQVHHAGYMLGICGICGKSQSSCISSSIARI